MPFKSMSEVPRGYILSSYLWRRMIQQNKNVLAAVIGKTGSGKSWANMSIAEDWYNFRFNGKYDFPEKNICFSIDELTKRLLDTDLKRGELIILEEGGVLMGNMDYQTKVAKTFNYVLQSFRSMNVSVWTNLPYFEMLNKSTRSLMHLTVETLGIDNATSEVILKPLMLQYHQYTGKQYFHFPKVQIGKFYEQVNRVRYPKPSQRLIDAYEVRKKDFVLKTIRTAELTNAPGEKKKGSYAFLSKHEYNILYLSRIKGLSPTQIQEITNVPRMTVGQILNKLARNGVGPDIFEKYPEFAKELPLLDKLATNHEPPKLISVENR